MCVCVWGGGGHCPVVAAASDAIADSASTHNRASTNLPLSDQRSAFPLAPDSTFEEVK